MKKFFAIILFFLTVTLHAFIPQEKDFHKIRDFKDLTYNGETTLSIATRESDITLLFTKEDRVSALWNTSIATGFGFISPKLIVRKNENKIIIEISFGEKYDFLSKNIVLRDPKLTVKIPEKFKDDLFISSVSGNIFMKNHNNNDIHIENISGNIKADILEANKLWIRSTSGNINVNRIKGENARIISVSGNIVMKEINTKNTFIKATSSSINIDSVDSYLEISGISSQIDITHLFPGNTLKLSTISGDVSLKTDNNKNKEFFFKTISGDIECETDHITDHKDRFSYSGHYMAGNSKRHSTIYISTVSGDINFKHR